MTNRRVTIYCPAATAVACRADIAQNASDFSGLNRGAAPISGAIAPTHYCAEATARQEHIDALDAMTVTHGLVWAYIDVGPNGIQYFTSTQEVLGEDNLALWTDPAQPGPTG